MERFSISSLFTRRWLMIVIVTVVIFAAALWQNSQKKTSYFGTFSVTVQATRNYPNSDKLILQASQTQDLQAAIATTQSWVADPFYVNKALSAASIDTSALSLKDYSKIFQVVSPVALSSTYEVQYTGESADEVNRVSSSLKTVLTDAQTSYDSKQGDITIGMSFTDPTVSTQSSGLPLVPIAGLVVGFIFALVVAAVYDRSRA